MSDRIPEHRIDSCPRGLASPRATWILLVFGCVFSCGCGNPGVPQPAQPTEMELLGRFNGGHRIPISGGLSECRMLGDFECTADGTVRWRFPGAVSFLISVPHAMIAADREPQILSFLFADPDGARVNCSGGEVSVIRGDKLTHIVCRHIVVSNQTTRGKIALVLGSHSPSGYSEIMEIRFAGRFERK